MTALTLVPDEVEGIEPLEDLINRYQRIEEDFKRAEAKYELTKLEVKNRLRSERYKAKTVDFYADPTKRLRAVYSRNVRVDINEVGLAKALGARVFNRITKKVVDRERLDNEMAVGQIDVDVVRPFLSQSERPSLRLYVVDRKDEEIDESEDPDTDR
jgi:hypothetical protein